MRWFLPGLFLVGSVLPASAQFYDARSMGLGGAPLRDGRATRQQTNPALYATRDLDAAARPGWALPLGLLQELGDLPQFDPDASDFDLTHVLQWQMQPPGPLAIGRQAPLADDVGLVDIDGHSTPTDDLAEQLPTEAFDLARAFQLGPLVKTLDLGQKYGVLVLGGHGFAHHGVDANLRSEAGTQTWSGWGLLQAGFGLQASYAREIRLGGGTAAPGDFDDYWDREDSRPRLFLGVTARRLFGVAMTHIEGATVTEGPFEYDVTYSSSLASLTGDYGGGWGFDLGAVLRWGRVELGLAAADLAASLDWSDVRRDQLRLGPSDAAAEQTQLTEGADFETDLPSRVLLDLRVRAAAHGTLLADLSALGDQSEAHLGYEWNRQKWLFRAGLGLDSRGEIQFGAGTGWHHGDWKVDLGLLTDSGNLDGTRALTLGLAVGLVR